MLTLTRKTEYALIAITHLARVPARTIVSARDIHDEHAVPLPLLMNILKKLNHAGFVESVRGARGGYRLAKPPGAMTLTALIEAIEGPVKLVRCAGPGPNHRRCDISPNCPIRRTLHRIHHRLHDFLAGITLAELALDGPACGCHKPVEVTRALAE